MPVETTSAKTIATDVLVIGAGPAGLATAIALRSHGHDVAVVDKAAAIAHTSRAAVVHAHTLEVLEPYDVARRLVAQGIVTTRFTFRDRDRILMSTDFDKLPTKYPMALFISQATTEQNLTERLAELGGKITRPHAFVSLAQDTEGVTATLDNGQVIRCKYLVGADGLHSTVREQVGIAFPEQTDGLSFCLADVTLAGDFPQNEGIIYFSPAGQLVVAPLPDGTFRLVASVDEAPENPSVQFVQKLVDERGPAKHKVHIKEIVWGSRFRIHHGVASTYVAGRVALVGDAAHVHSPAGGQGMNLSIQDGVMLGESLAAALSGAANDPLKTYEQHQRPIAVQVVAFAEQLTKIATVKGRRRGIRNLILRLVGPFIHRKVAFRLSQLVYKHSRKGE